MFSVRYLALTPFWTGREGKRYAAEKANYASDQRDVSNLSVYDIGVKRDVSVVGQHQLGAALKNMEHQIAAAKACRPQVAAFVRLGR